MNPKLIFFILLILATGILISMKTIFTDKEGPHGGRIKDAANYNIEAKAVYSNFYAYLLTKENIPTSNKNLACEIRFFILDGSSIDIPMKKYGADGFTMEYFSLDFNSYRITFTESGKTYNAKFETENVLVQNK